MVQHVDSDPEAMVPFLSRYSLVPVSEASVVIAVSSAHRAASLEAVSFAIDHLKAKVPIWKKVSSQGFVFSPRFVF